MEIGTNGNTVIMPFQLLQEKWGDSKMLKSDAVAGHVLITKYNSYLSICPCKYQLEYILFFGIVV